MNQKEAAACGGLLQKAAGPAAAQVSTDDGLCFLYSYTAFSGQQWYYTGERRKKEPYCAGRDADDRITHHFQEKRFPDGHQ